MSRETTLQRVEQDLRDGRLGNARDRLNALVTAFPDDLALRSKLGDVYWQLGYPADAGRCWFLDEEKTGEKREAVEAFVRSCGQNPEMILRRLKLRLDPESLKSATARGRVQEQIDECKKRGLPVPTMANAAPPPYNLKWNQSVMLYGCVALAVIILFLAFAGLAFLIYWLKGSR